MDGIIIINKPKNYTSHDIVRKAKKLLNEKVGHTGTLDPNATGVLPLLIGKGTLLSKYLIEHDKIYEAVLKLGEKTDTADGEGKVLESQNVEQSILKKENIERIFNNLEGKQEQIPPMYSAIKLNGKKLYEYARKGIEVEVKPRTIEIYKLELIKIEDMEITFRVSCSKGTYIRTLCEKIAEELGTVGYMKELKRIQVGEFNIKDSITIEELENQEIVSNKFITIEKYFSSYENIVLNERKFQLFLNGVQLTYELKDGIYKKTRKIEGSKENIENLDEIIIENGKLKKNIKLKARWRSSNDMRNFFNNQCRPTKAKISGDIVEIYFDNDKFNPQIKKATNI